MLLFCLCWFLTSQSKVLCRDWFHGWTSAKQRIKCLVQIHDAEPLVRLEPATPQSLHWATQLRNVTIQVNIMSCVLQRVSILSDTSHINCMVARCLINRGYLLFLRWILNIRIFISAYRVCWTHQNLHECVARVKILMFTAHEIKYIWYLPKKNLFIFYFL